MKKTAHDIENGWWRVLLAVSLVAAVGAGLPLLAPTFSGTIIVLVGLVAFAVSCSLHPRYWFRRMASACLGISDGLRSSASHRRLLEFLVRNGWAIRN